MKPVGLSAGFFGRSGTASKSALGSVYGGGQGTRTPGLIVANDDHTDFRDFRRILCVYKDRHLVYAPLLTRNRRLSYFKPF
jgi:hypothetical protein